MGSRHHSLDANLRLGSLGEGWLAAAAGAKLGLQSDRPAKSFISLQDNLSAMAKQCSGAMDKFQPESSNRVALMHRIAAVAFEVFRTNCRRAV